jgi:hypothetical protein
VLAHAAKERPLRLLPDAGGVDISVEVGLGVVVGRHFMALAFFTYLSNQANFSHKTCSMVSFPR